MMRAALIGNKWPSSAGQSSSVPAKVIAPSHHDPHLGGAL